MFSFTQRGLEINAPLKKDPIHSQLAYCILGTADVHDTGYVALPIIKASVLTRDTEGADEEYFQTSICIPVLVPATFVVGAVWTAVCMRRGDWDWHDYMKNIRVMQPYISTNIGVANTRRTVDKSDLSGKALGPDVFDIYGIYPPQTDRCVLTSVENDSDQQATDGMFDAGIALHNRVRACFDFSIATRPDDATAKQEKDVVVLTVGNKDSKFLLAIYRENVDPSGSNEVILRAPKLAWRLSSSKVEKGNSCSLTEMLELAFHTPSHGKSEPERHVVDKYGRSIEIYEVGNSLLVGSVVQFVAGVGLES